MMNVQELEWLKENGYLKEIEESEYKTIVKQHLSSRKLNEIKSIFNSYYLISNSVVWFDTENNVFKCTFTTNWYKDTNTERLNEKLKNEKLCITNVKIIKKQRNSYVSTSMISTTYYSNRDMYKYEFEIGCI